MLSQFLYFTLTYDIENAKQTLEELKMHDFEYFKKGTGVSLKKRVIKVSIREYLSFCHLYYISMFDIDSILKLRNQIERFDFSEEFEAELQKYTESSVKLFKGDLDLKHKVIASYGGEKENIMQLFYVAIIDCVNQDKESFEENRSMILRGNPETFYYKILERNTMESLLDIINDSKSKIDNSIWN